MFAVDILRLIASAQMINGHTLDALLKPIWEQGPFFDRYLWYRGLVSVAFLMVAGIAYTLATLHRFEKHKTNRAAVMQRLRRGVDLILIGYALRFPYAVFGADADRWERSWVYFQGFGVLQCIGVTLILLELLTLSLDRPWKVTAVATGTAVLILAASPLTDQIEPTGFLTGALTHRGTSPFPLFPWASYMLLGVGTGALVYPRGGRTPWMRSSAALVGLAVVAFLLNLTLKTWVNPLVIEGFTHHAAVPRNIFDKLAGLYTFLFLLNLLAYPLKSLPKTMSTLSGETLFIYWFHIVVLFHPPLYVASRLGRGSLDLPEAAIASLSMMLFMILATLGWHHFKAKGGWRQVPMWGRRWWPALRAS